MCTRGEIEPMPDAAIFADTQSEPKAVYEWLDWLEPRLAFPVYRVTAGNLAVDALRLVKAKTGNYYTAPSLPMNLELGNGKRGLMKRECTTSHKLNPITKKLRELKGNDEKIIQWIGISVDEAHRMKPSRQGWIMAAWPLVDRAISRRDCLQWMKAKGYPQPPRSSCYMCPFHNNPDWRKLRESDPIAFNMAAKWEEDFQEVSKLIKNVPYKPWLHWRMKPITEVPFGTKPDKDDQFGNECEGLCGV